jgi:hypothetical protein
MSADYSPRHPVLWAWMTVVHIFLVNKLLISTRDAGLDSMNASLRLSARSVFTRSLTPARIGLTRINLAAVRCGANSSPQRS